MNLGRLFSNRLPGRALAAVCATAAASVFGASCAPAPSGPNWIVGDSYTVGIDSTDRISGVYRSKTGATIDNRLPYLEEAADANPPVVFVVAGINNAPISSDSGYLLKKVRLGMDATVGARCVVWATYPENLSGSYAYLVPRVKNLNTHIRNEATARPSVVVADFAPVVAASPSLMAGDGLHLDPSGYRKLADLMVSVANSKC